MIASHKIILNTGVLYAKLLIVMVLGLISVRIILGALGETNYGIYSLVAGIVGMLGILQGAMANASMRFMSHSLGSNDKKLILQTFNTTLLLHFLIGILIVVIIEVGGIFMFKYFLNIPADKMADAKVIFHFMAITTFITIISVPYDAVINSHENLLFLSIVDILGAILKFGVAIYLIYSSYNLLIVYGFLLMLIQLIMRIIKQRYSIKHYHECEINFRKYYDKALAKTIFSFSGWNLFGSIASMSVTQVRALLLNMFFGVRLNAANGVAMQVTGQVNAVSASMTQALNPQLVKSEGGGNRDRMLRLTILSTKYSIFLFALFAVPVIIEMPYLFKLWLKEVPQYAVIFSRLILIGLLIDKFTFEITTAIRAVGDIKKLTVFEAVIALFNIPLGYLLFKSSYPPQSIYILSIFIALFAVVNRFYYGKKIAGLNLKVFFMKGVLSILFPIFLSIIVSLIPFYFINEGFLSFIMVVFVFIMTLIVLFWLIGMDKEETMKVKILVKSVFRRISRSNYSI